MKHPFPFFIILIFLGCRADPGVGIQGEILFPDSGAELTEGQTVQFRATANCEVVDWRDENGSVLSRELNFTTEAQPNMREIELYVEDVLCDTLSLVIRSPSSDRRRRIYGDSVALSLEPGTYTGYVVSTGPGTMHFHSKMQQQQEYAERNMGKGTGPHMQLFRRDIIIPLLSSGLYRIKQNTQSSLIDSRKAALAFEDSSNGETEKEFYVADITGANGGAAKQLQFRLIEDLGGLRFWCDSETYNGDTIVEAIRDIAVDISQQFYPRVKELFGEHSDVDANGHVEILFTNELNKGEAAIGFFNPNDLFERSGNNSWSNEGEIIYTAIPDDESFSYSSGSITATVCHETAHLIHFNNQVLVSYFNGAPLPATPDLFIDEGIAHLAETLCGVGVRGGNIGFYANFLANTAEISLTERNVYGMYDSVGKRGGMAAFLSWLFWRAGGAEWTDGDGVSDNGGITFLHDLIQAGGNAWDKIGDVLGDSTDDLFIEWMTESLTLSQTMGYVDPVTNEPLYLDPLMGSFSISEDIQIRIDGFTRRIFTASDWTLLPRSFMPLSCSVPDHSTGIELIQIDGNANSWLYLYQSAE